MSEHTIKFILPEEAESLKIALDAPKMAAMLFEFSEWLRRRYKHDDPLNSDVKEEYEAIKCAFFNQLLQHDVELYS